MMMRGAANVCCCLGALIGIAMVGALFGLYMAKKKSSQDLTQLRQINVVFVHGETTPNEDELNVYPLNEHRLAVYYPHGLEALTNDGKMTSFLVGENIRKQYDDLLGKVYKQREFTARSTDTDITKMSMLLFSAGLWPVSDDLLWQSDLRWQPIPFKYPQTGEDYMMFPSNCKVYARNREAFTRAFLETITPPYEDLFRRLSIFTGYNFTRPSEVRKLHNLLTAQENYHMSNPEWFANMKSDIAEVVKLDYNLMFVNLPMRRLSGGPILKSILQNVKKSIDDSKKAASQIRLHAYSGTKENIAAILATVENDIMSVPKHGATFVTELHYRRMFDDYAIKLLFWNDVETARVLKLPGCEELCPIEEFENKLNSIVNVDYRQECILKA